MKTETLETTQGLEATTRGPAIYLARPTADLHEKYGEVRQYLLQAGVQVLPAPSGLGDPMGERELAERTIAAATLFVQLLSGEPDPEAILPHGLSGLELERLARSFKKPILQWRDERLKLNEVEDPDQRDRLAGPTVYAEGIEEFKARIVREATAPPAPPPPECRLFIAADWPDRALAREITLALKEDHGPVALRDWSLPPREYRADLYRKLEVCQTVLVVCRDCHDSWIRGQFADILKVGIRRDDPAVKRLIDARPADRKGQPPPWTDDTLVLDCPGRPDPGAIRRWIFPERQEVSP
jgi:hypothetical protein